VYKNSKPILNKDLPQAGNSAYKSAYKQNRKITPNKAQGLPSDLAEILAVWPELPVHTYLLFRAVLREILSELA